jgi:hypothetical protein
MRRAPVWKAAFSKMVVHLRLLSRRSLAAEAESAGQGRSSRGLGAERDTSLLGSHRERAECKRGRFQGFAGFKGKSRGNGNGKINN